MLRANFGEIETNVERYESLNPCYSGCYARIIFADTTTGYYDKVLILVIVDVTRE